MGIFFLTIINVEKHFKECFEIDNEMEINKEDDKMNIKKENSIINNEIKDDKEINIEKDIVINKNEKDNFSYYECYRDGKNFQI